MAKGRTRGVPDNELTLRQREIALLVADGYTNQGVAEQANIGTDWVKVQLIDIYSRLGIHEGNRRVKLAVRVLAKPEWWKEDLCSGS